MMIVTFLTPGDVKLSDIRWMIISPFMIFVTKFGVFWSNRKKVMAVQKRVRKTALWRHRDWLNPTSGGVKQILSPVFLIKHLYCFTIYYKYCYDFLDEWSFCIFSSKGRRTQDIVNISWEICHMSKLSYWEHLYTFWISSSNVTIKPICS